MRVLFLDLYARAFAVGFAGERSKRGCQPVDRRAAEEIILRAQIEIPGDIRTAGSARPLGCFRQRYLPGFVEFGHFKKVKSKKVKGKRTCQRQSRLSEP